jgi:hypothetical protein
MTATEIMAQVIQIITGGIVEVGTALGEGVSALVQAIAFTGTGDTQEMSTFFILVLIFAGVSLALSLARLIINWIQGLGGGNV